MAVNMIKFLSKLFLIVLIPKYHDWFNRHVNKYINRRIIVKTAIKMWIMAMGILSLSFSCSISDDNIFSCNADMTDAEKNIQIKGTLLPFTGQPVMQIYNLHVVDSFLVVKASVKESSNQMFVFNLHSNKYTGTSFITKGRGPNELQNPFCYGSYNIYSDYKPLYIFDLSLRESYAFDVEASVNAGQTQLSKICRLPEGTLYAYPYRDSLHFVKVPAPECLDGMILNPDGSMAKKVALYGDVPGYLYFDKLSSADAFFSGTDMMAMAMTMLPQVNFIDVNTGEKHTVAIDKQYREWKQLLYDEMYTPTICYTAAIPAGSVVVALYYGVTLADWAAGDAPAHLHIFDADGGFLYDISLAESLKAIAYDRNSGMLYGADTEDRIYQYDMSDII